MEFNCAAASDHLFKEMQAAFIDSNGAVGDSSKTCCVPMMALSLQAVEQWIADLPLSNQSKNHLLHHLGAVLREALRE